MHGRTEELFSREFTESMFFKFSMIHILQFNSSPIFFILGKHELPAARIEWNR